MSHSIRLDKKGSVDISDLGSGPPSLPSRFPFRVTSPHQPLHRLLLSSVLPTYLPLTHTHALPLNSHLTNITIPSRVTHSSTAFVSSFVALPPPLVPHTHAPPTFPSPFVALTTKPHFPYTPLLIHTPPPTFPSPIVALPPHHAPNTRRRVSRMGAFLSPVGLCSDTDSESDKS